MEIQRQDGLPRLPRSLPKPAARWLAGLGIGAACAALALGGYWFSNRSLPESQARDTPPTSQHASSSVNPAQMFVGWTQPDFVLALTGQSHGYLQPCGCSSPQYGGLARRWEFLNSLAKKGWTIIPVDVGEIAATNTSTPQAQNLLKYETAMRALAALGYQAVGLGRDEFRVGLMELLPQYALNNKYPRHLALNIDGNPAGIYREMGVAPYDVIQVGKAPKIGVVGVVGAKLAAELKEPQLKPALAASVLPEALRDLKAKAEFNVVLFQGLEDEARACAQWCAEQRRKHPSLAPVHLILHNNLDPEPPGILQDVAGTQLVTVGHKGKYVGIVGVWRTRNGYQYKYQMVAIGPEFEPKSGDTNNPVLPLMEQYAKTVKERNLMARFHFGPHKTQRLLQAKNIEAKFVGSEICANCHDKASQVWSHSGHSHAYDTLVNATDPSLRNFDGECVQCHTVGFRYETGYNDPRIRARTKDLLKHVGCESCHGPASMHVNDPNNKEYYPLINEFAARHNPKIPESIRLRRIDDFCQRCHDMENDVHWDFQKKWPKIVH